MVVLSARPRPRTKGRILSQRLNVPSFHESVSGEGLAAMFGLFILHSAQCWQWQDANDLATWLDREPFDPWLASENVFVYLVRTK